MVEQHYRWDFVGLSTDTKPTPQTSEKVVDGSTFYCSDTSKLYVFCGSNWYERKPLGGGGGGGTEYTAGAGINISDEDVISVDTTTIQPKLTAGSNITISDNTISATDTTYSNFVGTDGTAAGTAGLVPAPATTDAGKFLKADGTWDTAGGGGGPTVVQTTGTSTTDVMSQNATSSLVYADPAVMTKVQIGLSANAGAGNTVAIGTSASTPTATGVAIGYSAGCGHGDSVALGSYAVTTRQGQISIKVNNANHGYDHSYYRLLSGVHDPVDNNDAATKGYVDATAGAVHVLSATDMNYDDSGQGGTPNSVALWLLPTGLYSAMDLSNVNSVWVGINPNDSELVDSWGLILIQNDGAGNSAYINTITPDLSGGTYTVDYDTGEITSGI